MAIIWFTGSTPGVDVGLEVKDDADELRTRISEYGADPTAWISLTLAKGRGAVSIRPHHVIAVAPQDEWI